MVAIGNLCAMVRCHMATRVKRRSEPKRVVIDIRKATEEWFKTDSTAKDFTTEAEKRKGVLKAALAEQVEADSDGHCWYYFDDDEPVGGVLRGVKREKRVSRRLNAERAERLLREKKLLERCTKTVVVLDEDAILAAAFEERLTNKELESLYDVSETFALVPIKVAR